MSKIVFLLLISVGLTSLLTACSSLKKTAFDFYMGGLKDEKSAHIRPLPPPSPYQKQDHSVLDAFWWNPQSKSSISYFSSCSKIQKTLKSFQYESFPPDLGYKILNTVKTEKSLYTVLKMDQKTYSGVYTLKHKDCYFNIQLVAPSQPAFNKEELVFRTFIKGLN